MVQILLLADSGQPASRLSARVSSVPGAFQLTSSTLSARSTDLSLSYTAFTMGYKLRGRSKSPSPFPSQSPASLPRRKESDFTFDATQGETIFKDKIEISCIMLFICNVFVQK